MIQLQQSRKKLDSVDTARYVAKAILFPIVFALAAMLAFPSLLLGLFLWWRGTRSRDSREFWRGTWAMAIFGAIVYAFWIWLGDPFPWLWQGITYSVVHRLWMSAWQYLVLLWLFNLWLGPTCAILLARLYLGRRKPFASVGQVKQPSVSDYERDEHVLTAQPLYQFERMTAALQSVASWGSSASLARAVTHVQASPVVVQAGPSRYEAIGSYEGGELAELVYDGELCLPPEWLELHGVLVGEPKHGKTTTLIRLATIAKLYGRKPIYLDLKGSKKTAALFLSAMSMVGARSVKLFPLEAYDGWRGDPQALYNRLMQQIDPGTHPFYRSGVGSAIISLAVKASCGPPRNSYEFLERLDHDWLKAAYATDAQAQREISYISPHIAGLGLVFAGFFRGVAGALDGTWAFEDAEACYIGINGIAHREEAAILGRYLIDDAAHFATSRKAPDEQVLLIVDEFGVLESTNTTTLYESVRESGMSVYAAGQSYQSLGPERESVLDASAVKILHRCGNPEPIIRYAGEREKYAFSRIIGGFGDEEEVLRPTANRAADLTSQQHTVMRPEKEYAIRVEDVQQLPPGKIALICGGRGAFSRVHALAIPQQIMQSAQRFIENAPRFQPLPPPTMSAPAQQGRNRKKQGGGAGQQGTAKKAQQVSARPGARSAPSQIQKQGGQVQSSSPIPPSNGQTGIQNQPQQQQSAPGQAMTSPGQTSLDPPRIPSQPGSLSQPGSSSTEEEAAKRSIPHVQAQQNDDEEGVDFFS
jgi:hypothetical protein